MLRRALAIPVGPDLVYPVALVLGVVLPFEAIRPLVVTPWLSLTDEKLALFAVVAAWLALGRRAWPSDWEWRALMPALALLGVGLVAALAAPEFGDEALRFVWRLAAGAFVLLLMLRLATDETRREGILWAILLGAGASGVLGIAEALRWPAFEPILSLFKVAPTRVGGELRVSASFQYATIAAMYFEMVVPLAIVMAARTRRRAPAVLAAAIGLVCIANVMLSLTRAGILTLGVILVILVVFACVRPNARRLLAPTLVSLGVLLGGVALLYLRNPIFDLRLVTESDADWYGAAYSAPTSLQVAPGQSVRVSLDVSNAGRITWSNAEQHPFALGFRWLTADGTDVLDLPPGEVALPRDVAPGETIHLEPVVDVPNLPAGAYRLDWGMLQRDVLQFYERGSADAETRVDVGQSPGGTSVALPATLPRDDGVAPWVVGRLELWGAALRLIETRPLLGVGPDNFRHLYGAELGLETWDERVQANNLYLEILADVGLLGLAAFVWLFVRPIRTVLRGSSKNYVLLGLGLGVLAFLVHGLLDSFLAFTPTALLLMLLLGMILGQKPHVSGR